jgi:hypothetical protein
VTALPALVTARLPALSVAELSREEAAEAAREELSRRPYQEAQPPLVTRLLGWLLRELGELLGRASDAAPGGRLGLLVLAALLALAVAVVVTRLRPGRGGRDTPLFGTAHQRTAAEHRRLADAAAAQGRYADAVRERLRAIVRELEARGVLDPRPGRTADEVAQEAGVLVPETAEDLRRAVRVFDEVWYGEREATPDSYDVLVEVDRRVTAGRLARR